MNIEGSLVLWSPHFQNLGHNPLWLPPNMQRSYLRLSTTKFAPFLQKIKLSIPPHFPPSPWRN